MRTNADTYRAFRIPIYLLAIALFVLLPASLLGKMSDVARLTAVVLVYLFTIVLSVLTWRYGKRHGEEALRKPARSLAIQILLCPPFALNVVRKLSLMQSFPCTLPEAAMRLLSTEDWQATAATLHAQINDEIAADEQGAALASLKAARTWLVKHLPPAED